MNNLNEQNGKHYREWLSFISFFLACLCGLGVLAYHFPEHLSTPRLRNVYDAEQLRVLLDFVMHASIVFGVAGIIFSKSKLLAFAGCFVIGVSVIAGGHTVEVDLPIKTAKYYLSLDFIILDLLFLTLVFIPFEKVFNRVNQRVLREGIKTDIFHYALSHLLMGGMFVLIAIPGNAVSDYFPEVGVGHLVEGLPLIVQALLILFLTDFMQYWIHRAFHVYPRLWQFHKIHHSSVSMDWLAGSRLHIMDILITRSVSYIPVVALGFSNDAVNLYLPIVAFQAVFVHSNFRYRLPSVSMFLTTPLIHHWHHSAEEEALDKNFAVSFSIIDRIFGTFYCPKDKWPKKYGLYNEKISDNFLKQLVYPFLVQTKRGKK